MKCIVRQFFIVSVEDKRNFSRMRKLRIMKENRDVEVKLQS
jgi:hypothetical protein